jgi:glucose/arabinose dehydrogenase
MPLRLATLVPALIALAVLAPPASAVLHLSSIGTFDQPVYVTAPPGDPHRVFVVEQPGRIIEVRDGVKQNPAFLDITSRVKSGGEQGLLSMAFAPDYATSGRYYVYYTAPRAGDSGGSVITVEEFSPSEHHVVFTVDHPTNSNHNGGQLQFGPDGMLYAATGDGGSGNDPPNNAQNPSSNLGKLLRVDPLSSTASRPSIYALGLRNPFRFSFDRQTGDLIIGDVGQNAREEVDFSAKGTAAGVNYGWRCWEGTLKNTNITPQCDPGNDVKPVLEKDHSTDGFCAIIGGYVVRDRSLGSLYGRYLYGDNCNPGIYSVKLRTGHAAGERTLPFKVRGLSSFGEDARGRIYLTALGGQLYRLAA